PCSAPAARPAAAPSATSPRRPRPPAARPRRRRRSRPTTRPGTWAGARPTSRSARCGTPRPRRCTRSPWLGTLQAHEIPDTGVRYGSGMNFTLSDEQQELQATVRQFVAANVSGREPMTDAVWQQMVDLGWVSLLIPEAHGGAGMGLLEMM